MGARTSEFRRRRCAMPVVAGIAGIFSVGDDREAARAGEGVRAR